MSEPDAASRREVIVGKNSAIWRTLSGDPAMARRFPTVLGHRDVEAFTFQPTDRVWVLSYSREEAANARLLQMLTDRGARDIVYFSSATTNVARRTGCYDYPRAKLHAETLARDVHGARIVTLGVLYRTIADLPAGTTIATSFDQLAHFMLDPRWTADEGGRVLLFAPVDKPFSGAAERLAYRLYAVGMSLAGRWPCALRPVDYVLRALGYRWYGYVYLSNRLWLTTTS